jgi:hypothetical protein
MAKIVQEQNKAIVLLGGGRRSAGLGLFPARLMRKETMVEIQERLFALLWFLSW